MTPDEAKTQHQELSNRGKAAKQAVIAAINNYNQQLQEATQAIYDATDNYNKVLTEMENFACQVYSELAVESDAWEDFMPEELSESDCADPLEIPDELDYADEFADLKVPEETYELAFADDWD